MEANNENVVDIPTTVDEVVTPQDAINALIESSAVLSNQEVVALINALLATRELTIQPRINVVVLDKEGKTV